MHRTPRLRLGFILDISSATSAIRNVRQNMIEFGLPMREQAKCTMCGTEMIQKSRARLFLVGVGMVASLGLPITIPLLWAPCIVAALTGAYLVVWATVGKARWCRQCKSFRLS